MKKVTTIIAATILTMNITAQTLQNEKDSASYAMGIAQAESFSREAGNVINMQVFSQGFFDYANSKDYQLPVDSVNAILQRYFGKLQAAEEAKTQEMCLAGKDFLLKNKEENKDVKFTESGLQYKVITETKGAKPTIVDTVVVHYKGTLIDGTIFDSSIERGKPATFPVNAVIPGFSEVLQLMSVGSKYIAYIPSELGYGMRDMGAIKPCSTLIFEIELLEIKTASQEKSISNDNTADKKSKKKSTK